MKVNIANKFTNILDNDVVLLAGFVGLEFEFLQNSLAVNYMIYMGL